MQNKEAEQRLRYIIALQGCLFIWAELLFIQDVSLLMVLVKVIFLSFGSVMLFLGTTKLALMVTCEKYEREYSNFKESYYQYYRAYTAYDFLSIENNVKALKQSSKNLVSYGNQLMTNKYATQEQKTRVRKTMNNATTALQKIFNWKNARRSARTFSRFVIFHW